ncbi:signal peptidase I [Zhihengliuella flava]|uniref:Signal peptidase I n=1 Tax=Zhihengliuella flava TaxID=1285193 RepID=A0A931D6X0_9MICC|nr:signal peptidase I [Zhihengliuella flava]
MVIIVAALVISLIVKTFFFRAFYIPSGSMEPTLEIDDRIFVNLMVPGPFDLQRGDVVVFRDELGWLGPQPDVDLNPVQQTLMFVGLMPDPANQHLVKRVIGLPGDTVRCCDAEGRVTVNGVALDETYIADGAAPSDIPFEVTVPDGKLWVLGDHRNASADSRFHQERGEGFIDLDDVEGTASVIVWPLDRIGVIDSHEEVFARLDAGGAQ